MKLLSHFCFLEEETEELGLRCYRLRLNPQHELYQAHFPGNPITPGVCLIELVSELLEKQTGRNLALKQVVNVKFLHVLSPAEHTHVEVRFRSIEQDGSRYKIKAVLQNDDLTFAQLSMIYVDANEAR